MTCKEGGLTEYPGLIFKKAYKTCSAFGTEQKRGHSTNHPKIMDKLRKDLVKSSQMYADHSSVFCPVLLFNEKTQSIA